MRVSYLQSLGITYSNDGANYAMWLELPYSQPSRDLEFAETLYRPPRVTQVRGQAATLILHFVILPASEATAATLREEILAALHQTASAVVLAVTDDDGGRLRYRSVVAQSPAEEQPDAAGVGRHFVATLMTHGDTMWTAVTPVAYDWTLTASGQTLAVTNPGSAAVRPVITVEPTANKVGGDSWGYRRFVAVPWDSWRSFNRYPVDLAWSDPLDTYQMLLDNKIDDETNIGVIVNGQEVRRWLGGYNTTETGVWANLDFQPGQRFRLGEGFAPGDVVTTLVAADYTRALLAYFPVQGMVLIGAEVFTYAGKDLEAGELLNVTRAAYGTTAAAHAADDLVSWLQHEIWLVYGDRTRKDDFLDRAPDGSLIGYDGYKPMIDLTNSGNKNWYWLQFLDATNPYRPLSWSPRDDGGHLARYQLPGDAQEIIVSAVSAAALGTMGGTESSWSVPVVRQIAEATIVGTRYLEEAVPWTAGIRTAGPAGYPMAVDIPAPQAVGRSESFQIISDSVAPSTEVEYLALAERTAGASAVALQEIGVEFATGLPSTPASEHDTYSMDATLTNATTAEALAIQMETAVGYELTIDGGRYTVTGEDGANHYQAVSKNTRRAELLGIAPGVNTLRVDEIGLTGVRVTVTFYPQYYS